MTNTAHRAPHCEVAYRWPEDHSGEHARCPGPEVTALWDERPVVVERCDCECHRSSR